MSPGHIDAFIRLSDTAFAGLSGRPLRSAKARRIGLAMSTSI
jgi:hypothetical protein